MVATAFKVHFQSNSEFLTREGDNFTWLHCEALPVLDKIISLYLFKIVADDLGDSTLRRKILPMIQSLSSILITGQYILKGMDVVLLLFLSSNAFLKISISMYHIICQNNKCMYT